MALNPGDLLNNGRYLIVEEVGSGGFGTVYKAVNTGLWSSRVAVKFSAPRFPPARNASEQARQQQFLDQARRQFEEEAKLLYELRHPCLPRVIDYFDEPGRGQFMVMDFIEGQSLADLLEEWGGPLPEAEALFYIRQVAGALDYLHSRTPSIIHRDVKPANIILAADNQVFLVDFGIAKIYVGDAKSSRNLRGTSSGFSPPEQYDPRVPTTPRSDIYALGATLYTLLTYTGRYEDELLEAPARSSHLEATRPPHEKNVAISEQTSAAVMRAISLPASERPAGVAEFLDSLPHLPFTPRGRPEPRPLAPTENYPDEATTIHPPLEVLVQSQGTAPRQQIRTASKLPMTGQTWLGRFQVDQEVHDGHVLAHDLVLRRKVEIWLWKMRHPTDTGSIHKMLGDYAKLQHEALATVLAHGNADGHAWVVVPHMSGGSLTQRLGDGKLDVREAMAVVERLAVALDYIHSRGAIHGELHPQLVQFDEAGAAHLCFLEFHKFMGFAMDTAWLMPPDYLDYRSPEYDSDDADMRSDVYSLGGILFAMLTGLSPKGYVPGGKKGDTPTPSAPAVEARGELSLGVRGVIDRALATNPAERYASAGELAAKLREEVEQEAAINTLSLALMDIFSNQPELLDPLARTLKEATQQPGRPAAAAKFLRDRSNRRDQPARLVEVIRLAADRPDLIAAYADLVTLLLAGLLKDPRKKAIQASTAGSQTELVAPPVKQKPAPSTSPRPVAHLRHSEPVLSAKMTGAPAALAIGSTFQNRYHITDRLSTSAGTQLFLARDPKGNKVTVRVCLFVSSPSFDKTMAKVARLEHWALAPTYEFGRTDDGHPFVVSAFYPGGSLTERLRWSTFSLKEAATVLYRVSDALGILHGHGLKHLRLDPDSIMFDATNQSWLSMHAIDPEQSVKHSRPLADADTGANLPTPYTSPEQVLGQAVDWRADIYALGIILFEMLAGEPPFHVGSFTALASQHLSAPVPIIRTSREDLPEELQAILERALAKDPARRYRAAYELGRALYWSWG